VYTYTYTIYNFISVYLFCSSEFFLEHNQYWYREITCKWGIVTIAGQSNFYRYFINICIKSTTELSEASTSWPTC